MKLRNQYRPHPPALEALLHGGGFELGWQQETKAQTAADCKLLSFYVHRKTSLTLLVMSYPTKNERFDGGLRIYIEAGGASSSVEKSVRDVILYLEGYGPELWAVWTEHDTSSSSWPDTLPISCEVGRLKAGTPLVSCEEQSTSWVLRFVGSHEVARSEAQKIDNWSTYLPGWKLRTSL